MIDKEWCLNGQKHREDGPAIEYENGNKEWWINGLKHREDGPAVEWADGHKEWWRHGKLHRKDGPAVECPNGFEEWYLHGRYHRKDGPARIWPADIKSGGSMVRRIAKMVPLLKKIMAKTNIGWKISNTPKKTGSRKP